MPRLGNICEGSFFLSRCNTPGLKDWTKATKRIVAFIQSLRRNLSTLDTRPTIEGKGKRLAFNMRTIKT